jgi:hypothetical protein
MAMRTRTIVCAGLLAASCVTMTAQGRKTERVVLVTLDGSRWQDVFGGLDEAVLRESATRGADITKAPAYRKFWAATPEARREKLMPFLWRTLARDGLIAGNRPRGSTVSVTNGMRVSYPGYSEILTGRAHDDVITGNDAIQNRFPSVLQFVRHKLNLPASKVATFASWGIFSSIVENRPGDTTVNAGLQTYESPAADVRRLNSLQFDAPTPWDNIRHDAFTFAFAMDYLVREHPTLMLLALDETDDWAHDGKYELVLDALHRTDHDLETLWNALQRDPFYRGRTTLVVTADHGRGRSGGEWRRHSKSTEGSDEIWLAIVSPDVAMRGEWLNATLFQNQIAATVVALLGLDYREQDPAAGRPLPLWNGGSR